MVVVETLRFVLCFFFKQKTAYEMRISDWSSDVCSSDLRARHGQTAGQILGKVDDFRIVQLVEIDVGLAAGLVVDLVEILAQFGNRLLLLDHVIDLLADALRGPAEMDFEQLTDVHARRHAQRRSEEQTSELQSLKRIANAVLCLKNKIH